MERMNCNRDIAKQYLTTMLYSNDKIINSMAKNKFITNDIRNCIIEIKKHRLMLLKFYPQFVQYSKNNNKDNIIGSSFSNLVQTVEREILLSMVDFFKSKNIGIGGLIFDGLHVMKCIDIDKLMMECCQYIKSIIDIDIVIIKKEFSTKRRLEESIKNFDDLAIFNRNMFNNVKINKFKSKYLTKLNKDDSDGTDLFKKITDNKIHLIKSETGTGKTVLCKKVLEKYKGYKNEFVKKYKKTEVNDKIMVIFRQAKLIKQLLALFWDGGLLDNKTIKIFTGSSPTSEQQVFINQYEKEVRTLFNSIKRKTLPKNPYKLLGWLDVMLKEFFGGFVSLYISNRRTVGNLKNKHHFYNISINCTKYLELLILKNISLIDNPNIDIIKKTNYKCHYKQFHSYKLLNELIINSSTGRLYV